MHECSETGCGRPHEAHGFCRLHYRRWRKHGDTAPRKMGKPYTGRTVEQVRAYIAANVTITDSGCWEWRKGTTKAGGYASLQWHGISPGHRVSYSVHVGPIPAGLLVCHRCDNPPCMNPDDLFVGTYADNNADMTGKGRARRVGFTTPARGERHFNARLTDAQVEEIRNSTGRGVDLAARFGIAQQTVCNIRKGRRRA